MINVRIKLYGTLRRHRPATAEGTDRQPFAITLPATATISTLLTELAITEGYVGAVAINGEAAAVDTQLHDGDDLRLFPPSAGG